MKKTSLLLAFIAFTLFSTQAQIKVWPGGKTIVGSTGTSIAGSALQVAGRTYFSTATGTVTATSAAYIRSTQAFTSASTPDYTWYKDSTTGIFHSAASLIQFTVGGSEKFRMNSSGQLLNTNSTSVVTKPDFSWNSDDNTGFYRPNTDILGFVTNGIEKMRVLSNGNTIINGTTDWGARFSVWGASNQQAVLITATHTSDYGYACVVNVDKDLTKAFSVQKNSTEKFVAYGNGDIWYRYGTSWSDRNLKENIDTLTDALNKIKQLTGYTYKFKASFTGSSNNRNEIGLIAQDVEQVVPEVVLTNENGIKGIAYGNLIPLLIEAIKEQNKNITDQQTQIEKLQNDLNSCCTQRNTNGTTNRSTSTNEPETNKLETSNWLSQNKPNPFNKETVIEYNVVQNGKASIMIFDMNGKLLKTIPVKIPGKGSVTITANDLSAGMYYYTLVVNDEEVDTKKMILTE